MERIVGEMEEEETDGDAIEGMESGDRQRDRDQEGDGGQEQGDKEDESEAAAVEHVDIEAQVHRGGRVNKGVADLRNDTILN